MFLTEFARGFNGAEEGADNLLHHLGIEGKLSSGAVIQVRRIRPASTGHAGLFVRLHAEVPHAGSFPLRLFEAAQDRR